MTPKEEQEILIIVKRLLESLGYDTQKSIHEQFLNKYHKELVENPAPKRLKPGPKKKLK